MAQNDFETLTRQYWTAWGDAMRAAGAAAQPAPAAMPGWNDALAWWSQLARGAGAMPGTASGIDDALDRFNSQARDWYGQIQQLAARFAGRNAAPADIAAAWRQMIGAQGYTDLFKSMSGPGQHGLDQWMEQMAPLLQSLQQGGRGWLGMPAFGFAREHQERWQALAQAQLEYQEKNGAYNALMAEIMQLALRRFEDRLATRSQPGQQLTSTRALFDLWIDAAEDAYAEVALSPRFRQVYGEYVNSQMRVRAGLQGEVERICDQLGVPSRTEVDAAHRKIVQLERELRRLRDQVQRQQREPTGSVGEGEAKAAPGKATRTKAARASAGASPSKSARPAKATQPAAKSSGKPKSTRGNAR